MRFDFTAELYQYDNRIEAFPETGIHAYVRNYKYPNMESKVDLI